VQQVQSVQQIQAVHYVLFTAVSSLPKLSSEEACILEYWDSVSRYVRFRGVNQFLGQHIIWKCENAIFDFDWSAASVVYLFVLLMQLLQPQEVLMLVQLLVSLLGTAVHWIRRLQQSGICWCCSCCQ